MSAALSNTKITEVLNYSSPSGGKHINSSSSVQYAHQVYSMLIQCTVCSSYQSVQCVCVCVGVCVRACMYILHSYAWTLVDVHIMFCFSDNIFRLDVRYVCYIMLVQYFEPQCRRSTNFHYHYHPVYSKLIQCMVSSSSVQLAEEFNSRLQLCCVASP